jgi:Zn finger protein HypA/HybF involved in hydrogenase expression
MSAYDLNCPACGHRWQHEGGDPDVAGIVCPRCRNDDIEIEEDDLCDE